MGLLRIEVQNEGQWHVVATLAEEDEVDRARSYCDRAVRVLRQNGRVIGPEGEIVYEGFYNDPDIYIYDPDEGEEIRWQQAGF